MTLIARISPDSDSEHHKRRRLRSLAILPTLITLGNLICGFAAIHFGLRAMYDLGAGSTISLMPPLNPSILERMLPSPLSVGAGLIILGMILDLFDGLIARVTRSTTNFGGQLDSLADVVTCGVAPATLMIAFMTRELAGDFFPSPVSEHFLGRIMWISAAFYVACAAIRLARFNVEHASADHDYKSFRGIPSPGAAAVIAAMLIFQDQPEAEPLRAAIAYALPIAAILMAFLMVSRVPYGRLHRGYLMSKQPVGQFFVLLLLLAVFFSYKSATFLIATFVYTASGPVAMIIRQFREKKSPHAIDHPIDITTDTTSTSDHRNTG